MDISEYEYGIIMKRVKAGAALLDRHWTRPQDWRNGIDLERLDITDLKLCVLGQLYGSYITGLTILQDANGAYFAGWEAGFSGGGDVFAEHLTAVWRDYLEAS